MALAGLVTTLRSKATTPSGAVGRTLLQSSHCSRSPRVSKIRTPGSS
jgi:hypothetical protein